MIGKDMNGPVGLHQMHLIGNGVRAFHSGRALRHVGDGESYYVRPFAQQSLDIGRGNLTLDDVTTHHGCVASRFAVRHSQPPALGSQVRDIVGGYAEALLSHVLRPPAAATAGRTFVDFDFGQSAAMTEALNRRLATRTPA